MIDAAVYARIQKNAGVSFHTLRGHAFTYVILGDALLILPQHKRVSFIELEDALAYGCKNEYQKYKHLFDKPSYVFGILSDARINP